MCKIITNKAKIQEFIYIFFAGISTDRMKKVLCRFSKKRGYGTEFIGFLFSNEIDESFHAHGELKEDQILLSVDFPAAEADCEAYLDYKEFYGYLETAIIKVIADDREEYDEFETKESLSKVKKGLGL